MAELELAMEMEMDMATVAGYKGGNNFGGFSPLGRTPPLLFITRLLFL